MKRICKIPLKGSTETLYIELYDGKLHYIVRNRNGGRFGVRVHGVQEAIEYAFPWLDPKQVLEASMSIMARVVHHLNLTVAGREVA